MPCNALDTFFVTCGHVITLIQHADNCRTHEGQTTLRTSPFFLSRPPICSSAVSRVDYNHSLCPNCSSQYPELQNSESTLPYELIDERIREYMQQLNEQYYGDDLCITVPRAAEDITEWSQHWLETREAERLAQENSGVELKNQSLVFDPDRQSQGSLFMKKVTGDNEQCPICLKQKIIDNFLVDISFTMSASCLGLVHTRMILVRIVHISTHW